MDHPQGIHPLWSDSIIHQDKASLSRIFDAAKNSQIYSRDYARFSHPASPENIPRGFLTPENDAMHMPGHTMTPHPALGRCDRLRAPHGGVSPCAKNGQKTVKSRIKFWFQKFHFRNRNTSKLRANPISQSPRWPNQSQLHRLLHLRALQ